MPTYDDRETEALDTYGRYVATRARIESGDVPWSALAEFFTEDAVFIDPAWGRIDGNTAIARFMEDSMAGIDWEFPEEWTMVDGDRVVTMFQNRIHSPDTDGPDTDSRQFQAPGVSILTYAGNGKFSAETDIINMVHMFEVMKESGWEPSGPMNLPPSSPRRD